MMRAPTISRFDASNGGQAATAPAHSGNTVFYRYRGPDGRIVISDTPDRIPRGERERAERVQFAPTAEPANFEFSGVHWPSFAYGFAAAVTFGILLFMVARGSSRALGILLLLLVAGVGSAAYFGWLRRTTGQSDAPFASPSALIEDARRAVEKVKQHQADQDRTIEQIQREK